MSFFANSGYTSTTLLCDKNGLSRRHMLIFYPFSHVPDQGYRTVHIALHRFPALVLSCQGALDQHGPALSQRLLCPTRRRWLGGYLCRIERIQQAAERQDDKSLIPSQPRPGQPSGSCTCSSHDRAMAAAALRRSRGSTGSKSWHGSGQEQECPV